MTNARKDVTTSVDVTGAGLLDLSLFFRPRSSTPPSASQSARDLGGGAVFQPVQSPN